MNHVMSDDPQQVRGIDDEDIENINKKKVR